MPSELYEFGDVTVDLRRVEVRRAGEIVPLEPKSFDVLRHLLENRDRLVTKDELLDAVWKDTFVTPNVLTRAIAQLRKGLGDDAFEARYIETVAKRGYRFIAPVGVSGDGEPRAVATAPPELAPERVAGPEPDRRRMLTWALAGVAIVGALAGAGLWRAARDRATTVGDTTPLTPRRLTVGRNLRAGPGSPPAISPAGDSVAYPSNQTGTAEIYVASLAPGSREQPITTDGGDNVQPAFSPDGRWLAYHSRKRGGIWVVPSTGGAPTQVAESGSAPAWSPDSQSLVFTSYERGLSSQGVLWTVRRDGTTPAPLTTAGNPPGGHVAPTWSHDGRRIVFRVGRDEDREIWIVEAGGNGLWRLAARTGPTAPRFSPDDRAVYWVSETAENQECLMRVRLNAEGRADGGPEVVVPFPGYRQGSLSIARDGTAILSLGRLAVNLFAIDVDDGGGATPPRQLTFDDVLNRYPDYSDTGRIAFQQEVAGRPIAVWLIDDDGQNPEPLSAGLAVSVQAPQWDPEAKRVFARVIEPGSEQPYFGWIDLASRRLTRIATPASAAANLPSLSPDGRKVAFHEIDRDGVLNVWVQRLDDGARRQVTFDREAISYPRWSQDGRWLAVNIKRGGDEQVGVVPAEGGPVQQLTTGRGQHWPYTFAPDNDRIAFGGGLESGPWNIYAVSRRTRQVKQLTHFSEGMTRFPAWSPHGNRIVFVRGEQTTSLWTLKLPSPR